MTEVSGPAGTVKMGYTSWYNQLAWREGLGPRLQNHYGDDNLLDSTTVAGQGSTKYSFDGRGRVRTVIDPEEHLMERVYADAGAQNTISVGTGTVSTGVVRASTYGYDAYGRLYTATDPDQKTTTLQYDVLNRETFVTGPDQSTVQYVWGALFLDQLVDPEGQAYQWTRNALGWATSEVRPGDTAGVHLATEYDRYGRVSATVNRRGQRVGYTYDDLDRVASRSADGVTTTYAYSADDPATPSAPSWVAASNPESTDTLRFDSRGRLTDAITHRPTSVGTRRYLLQPRYDGYGRRTALWLELPGGARDTLSWGYDPNAFRLRTFVDWAGGATRFGYDAEGLPSSDTLPPGQMINRAYLSSHQLASIRYNVAGLDDAAGLVFEYDRLDRVRKRTNAHNDEKRVFAYDAVGQLTEFDDYEVTGTTQPTCQWDDNYGWVCSDPSTVWTHVGGENFAYDLERNPTDRGAVEGAGYRLRAFNGYSLGYDLDGNLTNKYNGSFSQTLSWNSLGQLASVTTNGSTIGFGYDGFGRRVRTTYPDGRVVRHVYDGDHLLMELDAGGNVDAKYTYYPGVDRPHAMIRGGVTYYYGSDQQGSVLALFNGGSQVVNRYSYLPFGEAETVTEGVANPLRYAGREYEAATGLYYNRNRWYDPMLHRFISEDPIGSAGGLNLYAYVENDPVNNSDPSGLTMQASIVKRNCLLAYGQEWCETVYMLEPITVTVSRYGSWRYTLRGPNHGDSGERRWGGAIFGDGPDFSYLRRSARALDRFNRRAQQVRVRGHREFPREENSEMRHACASFVLASEFGGWPTRIFGFGNEVQGFVRWDIPNLNSRLDGTTPWAFQLDDLRSNELGIAANALGAEVPTCERVR